MDSPLKSGVRKSNPLVCGQHRFSPNIGDDQSSNEESVIPDMSNVIGIASTPSQKATIKTFENFSIRTPTPLSSPLKNGFIQNRRLRKKILKKTVKFEHMDPKIKLEQEKIKRMNLIHKTF